MPYPMIGCDDVIDAEPDPQACNWGPSGRSQQMGPVRAWLDARSRMERFFVGWDSMFLSEGAIKAAAFAHGHQLVPLLGPPLQLGMVLALELRNTAREDQEVSVSVYGTPPVTSLHTADANALLAHLSNLEIGLNRAMEALAEKRAAADVLEKQLALELAKPVDARRLFVGPGARGEHVRRMQDFLRSAGFPCGRFGSDGIYGPATRTALEAWQRANGKVITGTAYVVDLPTLELPAAPAAPPTRKRECLCRGRLGCPEPSGAVGLADMDLRSRSAHAADRAASAERAQLAASVEDAFEHWESPHWDE